MQTNHHSKYVTFELTEAELRSAYSLGSLTKALFQNTRVEIIEQLLALTPDVSSEGGKQSYWQQEAFLKGQLALLDHLIEQASINENTEGN